MNIDEFIERYAAVPAPVILLEGTRDLPPANAPKLTALAAELARRLPRAIFRSGNAPGSDAAWAAGVELVDVSRLELVVPDELHRAAASARGARRVPLAAVTEGNQTHIDDVTAAASPALRSTVVDYRQRRSPPRVAAKVRYLLRDTLKVAGDAAAGLAPATVALLHLHPQRPTEGGTAHTRRVCRLLRVPCHYQDEWLDWVP